jgi:phosphoglycerol transferase
MAIYAIKLSHAENVQITVDPSLHKTIFFNPAKPYPYPLGLKYHIEGLYSPETWGAWSDGPELVLTFENSFDKPFILRLNVVHVFMENLKEPLRISAGGDEKELRISGPGEYSIVITPVEPTFSLTIAIPATMSPRDLGINQETRKLGIGLSSITIVPNENQ